MPAPALGIFRHTDDVLSNIICIGVAETSLLDVRGEHETCKLAVQ